MEKGGVMTRKDSEKDAERPHYYSQFWLDIAAGRGVIGGPKPEDAEANEAEAPEPALVRKTVGRSAADTIKETRASAVVEPEIEEEEEEQDNTVEEADIPTIVFDEDAQLTAEGAEEDLNEEETEPGEEGFGEDEEEEEEDEDEWSRRGGARKKPKPVRPTKPVKKPKREIRRNF
jgi:hypothetical protein